MDENCIGVVQPQVWGHEAEFPYSSMPQQHGTEDNEQRDAKNGLGPEESRMLHARGRDAQAAFRVSAVSVYRGV